MFEIEIDIFCIQRTPLPAVPFRAQLFLASRQVYFESFNNVNNTPMTPSPLCFVTLWNGAPKGQVAMPA